MTGPAGDGYGFVLKLDPSGTRILYAAYLGGSGLGGTEGVNALALDGTGNVYVAGTTNSRDFPVTLGAFQSSAKCNKLYCQTGFVSKLNATGTALVYSTLLGGSDIDAVSGIAVDASGAAYVTGRTTSPDFPVTLGALQQQRMAGFVTKLNSSGSALIYSALSGGAAIAVDRDGYAYATGGGFVTKLNPTGTGAVYSTFVGPVSATAIGLDGQGNAYITGSTFGGLPVSRAFQPSFYGGQCVVWTQSGNVGSGYKTCSDAFVAALNSSGSGLLYSTYLNGSLNDTGMGIAVDPQGNTYVVGNGALNVAAASPLSNNGGAFVVKVSNAHTPPLLTRESVTNGASFVSGLVLPGGLATIFCANLTGIRGILRASSLPLPTELAGVTVKINGVPAPLLAVADVNGQQQINLQVPFEAASTADPLDVEVMQNGVSAWVTQVKTKTTPPGIFTVSDHYGTIQHGTDYSLVTPASPAEAGEVIILYGTGFGWVNPAVPSGMPAPSSPPSATTIKPTVTIGGEAAEVLFFGLTPGFSGLYQLNVRMPLDVKSGDQHVVVSLPPVRECCGAGTSLLTVRVDSKPVKISVH